MHAQLALPSARVLHYWLLRVMCPSQHVMKPQLGMHCIPLFHTQRAMRDNASTSAHSEGECELAPRHTVAVLLQKQTDSLTKQWQQCSPHTQLLQTG